MKKQSLLFFVVAILGISIAIPLVFGQPLLSRNPQQLRYPSLNFKPPPVERVKLTNGMILYILEDHELPLVNMHAVIPTGSYFDPIGKEGLAELTSTVMRTGGTETMNGSAIDEVLESLAVNISIAAQMDLTTVSFSSLKNHADKGIDILSQMLMHPVFAGDKLNLAKNLKIEELKRIGDDPQQLAFREFNRVLYRGNPRGRLSTIRSIEALTRDDLTGFHKRYVAPNQIMIAITGDISKRDAVNLLEKYFGSWNVRSIKEEISPPVNKLGNAVYHVPKDIPQSVIITGKYAPAKATHDFYPFTVMDFIVGSGGFPSRVFQQIRTDQGLAYSAGSFYRARNDYGVFGTYAITKTESTGKVLSLLHDIEKKVSSAPVMAKELIWAKNSINNSFIFSFGSSDQIARQQMMIEFDKLPQNFLIDYPEHIKKVSIAEVSRVARTYLSSPDTIALILGKTVMPDQLPSSFGTVETLKTTND